MKSSKILTLFVIIAATIGLISATNFLETPEPRMLARNSVQTLVSEINKYQDGFNKTLTQIDSLALSSTAL